jgi:hypothetical protein
VIVRQYDSAAVDDNAGSHTRPWSGWPLIESEAARLIFVEKLS